MSELDHITTDELLDELTARSRSLVVGMDPLADQGMFRTFIRGSKLGSIGLVHILAFDAERLMACDDKCADAEEST